MNAAPTGLLVDAVGNLLVTGLEYQGNIGFVVKLTPTCDTIWTHTFRGTAARVINTSLDYPTRAPDGDYVISKSVSRRVGTNGFATDQTILKLSASTGQTVWSKDLSGFFATNPQPGVEYADGIGRTPTGFLLSVKGALPSQQRGLYGTLQLDDAGNLGRLRLRQITQASQSLSFPFSLLDRQGNTVVATRQTLTKLNPVGDTLFSVSPPPGPTPVGSTWDAAALIEDAQGNYVVLGNTTNTVAFGNDFHLTRFRPNGQLVKDTLLYQRIRRTARSLVLAPSGALVLTGFTETGPFGGRDLVALQFRGFRPLANRGSAAAAGNLDLYPNPAAGAEARLLLPAGPGGGSVAVYDALGRVVARQAVRGAATAPVALAVAGLPPGLYLVHYQDANGRTATARLLRP